MRIPQFIQPSFAALAILLLAAPVASRAWQAAPSPTQIASQEDRQKMMDLLHITSLRNGANGSNPQAPNYANYTNRRPIPTLCRRTHWS